MIPIDAALKSLASIVSLAFGLVVLSGGPKRRTNQALAGFLILIAGNQLAEAMRAWGSTPGWDTTWLQVATVFAAFDPLVLYYFAAIFPTVGKHRRPKILWLLVGLSAGFAASAILVPPIDDEWALFPRALRLYTASVYIVVAWDVLERLSRAKERRSARFLLPALLIAAFPPASVVGGDLSIVLIVQRTSLSYMAQFAIASTAKALAIALLATCFALVARRLLDPRSRQLVGRSVGLGAVVAILLQSYDMTLVVATGFDVPRIEALANVGRASASIRWLLFGGFVSMAILREDGLEMPLASRRRAARVLISVATLTGGGRPGSDRVGFPRDRRHRSSADRRLSRGCGRAPVAGIPAAGGYRGEPSVCRPHARRPQGEA